MDSIQAQIVALHVKVDALQNVLEQVNARVLESMALNPSAADVTLPGMELYPSRDPTLSSGRGSHSPHPSALYRDFNATFEHKDILADDDYVEDSHGVERSLEPTIQIQRLTAQLTAAYNRIAALEEQLLAQRSS